MVNDEHCWKPQHAYQEVFRNGLMCYSFRDENDPKDSLVHNWMEPKWIILIYLVYLAPYMKYQHNIFFFLPGVEQQLEECDIL